MTWLDWSLACAWAVCWGVVAYGWGFDAGHKLGQAVGYRWGKMLGYMQRHIDDDQGDDDGGRPGPEVKRDAGDQSRLLANEDQRG